MKHFYNIGLAMEYLLQPWCCTIPMYVGCKVWNTVSYGHSLQLLKRNYTCENWAANNKV